jgi:hypothetical protein
VDKLQERSYYLQSFYKNYYFEIDSSHIKSYSECGFEILNSGYTIRFELFDCKEIQRYASMGRFNMVGTMRHIDHEAKEIGFKLCMDPV